MPLEVLLEFALESDRNEFRNQWAERLRSAYADGAAGDDESLALRGATMQVPSQAGAKELCHALLAYVTHEKDSTVTLRWKGANALPQHGDISAGGQRDAEVVAIRLAAAAKASQIAAR